MTKFYFKEWFPARLGTIRNQMGRTGARLFVPPFLDPLNPNIHPLIWRGINLLGTHVAEAEEEAGHAGVAQNILYTSWWEGNSLQQPWFHNMVSVLTEAASPNVASPVTQKLSELTGNTPGLPEYASQENQVPIRGKVARGGLRDVVEYEYTAAMAVLDTAACGIARISCAISTKWAARPIHKGRNRPALRVHRSRDAARSKYRRENGQSLDRPGRGGASRKQRIHGRRRHLSERVVCVSARAALPSIHQGHHAEPQHYPDIRAYPGGPPVPPYDVAGWTLPLQMGVTAIAAKSRFDASLSPVTRAGIPPAPRSCPRRR